VGCKKSNLKGDAKLKGWGDAWSWFGIDADSRLLVGYHVGGRTTKDAAQFTYDLRERIRTERVMITTDQFPSYLPAIHAAFMGKCDHARLCKIYGTEVEPRGRFSPSKLMGIRTEVACGAPDPFSISTSYVERLNLQMRMTNRRFTRLTNGHSKKLFNLQLSVALSAFTHNFCKPHQSLGGKTPAQAAGLTQVRYTTEELVEAMENEGAI
jgi:IS1 family transposase